MLHSGKILAILCSLTVGIVAIVVVITRDGHSQNGIEAPTDNQKMAQRFLDYHGTHAATQNKKDSSAEDICVPCAARAAA
jgi:hypothetical protein